MANTPVSSTSKPKATGSKNIYLIDISSSNILRNPIIMHKTVLTFARRLSGYAIIEEVNSSFNGPIQVIKEFGQIRIVTADITQSGEPIQSVWRKAVASLRHSSSRILILGLGAGTLATMLAKKYPRARLTGVEIDPDMVRLGKKYLNLGNLKNLKIIIRDAAIFCHTASGRREKYDLIFVDLYQGKIVPSKLDSSSFFKSVLSLLQPSGRLFVNRLFYDPTSRSIAQKTLVTLEKLNPGHITLIRSFTNLILCVSHSGIASDKQL